MTLRLNAVRCVALATALAAGSSGPGVEAAYGDRVTLRVISAAYRDLDGDRDMFPDTGETGRVVVTVENFGKSLTGVTLYLSTDDPNVASVTTPAVSIGALAAGEIRTVGSFDPAEPGFGFRASDSLQTASATSPAVIVLRLSATAFAFGGSSPIPFWLPADLDIPPDAAQTFTLGPDGVGGTADDGTLRETFDADRDGDGVFSTADTFGLLDAGTGVTGHGYFMHGGADGGSADVLAGIACGGYTSPAEGNLECRLDTDYPMDWHFHCPPTATNCPNTESGGFGAAGPGCVGGCSYKTPADGQKALSPPNSLHMGAHFDQNFSALGDTTHLRTLQAFVSSSINLALLPRDASDLKLSFYHIVSLVDNPYSEGGPCQDCALVQMRTDRDPSAAVDDWGPWDTLVPFQNVYTRAIRAWSYFGGQYCELTPTDTGTAPPAPRGVHETMCFDTKAWGHCGSSYSTGPSVTYGCSGGVVDPSGKGVWVQSKFDLARFLGQRIQIRWIGTTWQFDDVTSSYFEYGTGWNESNDDNGWWLDDIQITGTIQAQSSPALDTRPSPGSICPATCDATVGDRGTNVAIVATDTYGRVIYDGFNTIPVASQYANFMIDASGSSFPGGCLGGWAQFQYFVNGQLAQNWTSGTLFATVHRYLTSYTVRMRCSTDSACTSLTGATLSLLVDSQDGDDTIVGESISPLDLTRGVVYDGLTRSTTLRFWTSRNGTVDLYRGQIGPGISKGTFFGGEPATWLLDTTGGPGSSAACFLSHLPVQAVPGGGGAGTSGPLGQDQDPDPAEGFAVYYLAARDGSSGSSLNGLGCANPGLCGWGDRAGAACATHADCPVGKCLSVTLQGGPIPPPFGCPYYDIYKTLLQVPSAALCP